MKKLKVAGLLLLMALGFAGGWYGFNYAANYAEGKILSYGDGDEGITRTITLEELEENDSSGKVTGRTRSVDEWTQHNLLTHYNKHKAEFPEYKSAGEYKLGSEKFFTAPPPGTQIKIAPNGDRMYYHEKSNTFGVLTKWGTPKTFFRPNKGKRYWKRQKGKLLISKPQKKSEASAAEPQQ